MEVDQMSRKEKYYLDKNWRFALDNSSETLLANDKINIRKDFFYDASVPGTLHTDLINNEILEDPFYSDNENNLAGIDESDWIYSTEFNITSKNDDYRIVFNGLDTITEIFLNDKLLSKTDNMFCKYSFDINDFIIEGKNELKIIFKSPTIYSRNEEDKYGKLDVALNSSRVYIRKAQYSYGWDWGPVLTTSGIWKDVYIEKKAVASIENIIFNTISVEENEAIVEAKVFADGKLNNSLNVKAGLSIENVEFVKKAKFDGSKCKIKFKVKSPKLWYPNGEGEQNLYTLKVEVVDEDENVIDQKEKKVGIRTIELHTTDGSKADFYFKVNGKKLFAKGVNWIPTDSFLTRINDDKYFDLLKMAKDANMNIVRVWGGGIYEKDSFYEYCDQLGLLVWQDFMFACGSYPQHKAFIENISEEIYQNVSRLQSHPSITIWCGNNENEWLWYQASKKPISEMPGYEIFNSVIPKILDEIDPYSNYWQSSPFGFDEDPNSQLSGNTHQWGLWSSWEDYTNVKKDKSLFVTEFGFQAPANISTFTNCLPKENRKYNDVIFEHHNKQIEGPERVVKFLSSHLPIETDWEDFIYLTQLNQGLALKTCLEHWRMNNITNGSIIWQLNDCWPVTSWALIDWELKPKLSYHFVKNSFSQIFVQLSQTEPSIRILNTSLEGLQGNLKVDIISTTSGEIISNVTHIIDVASNSEDSVKLKNLDLDNPELIIVLSVYDSSNNLLVRNFNLKKRWKHVKLKKSNIQFDVKKTEGRIKLLLQSNIPEFFVDVCHPLLRFNKKAFTILPNETVEIESEENVKIVEIDDIKIFSLNNYLHK